MKSTRLGIITSGASHPVSIQTIVNFRDNRRIRSTGVLDIFRDRFNYAEEESRTEVGEEQAEGISAENDEGEEKAQEGKEMPEIPDFVPIFGSASPPLVTKYEPTSISRN